MNAVVAAIAFGALGACGGDNDSRSPTTTRLLEAADLVPIALTEEEGQPVVVGFTLYPHSPPVGPVSNEELTQPGGYDEAFVERLVDEFHRRWIPQ